MSMRPSRAKAMFPPASTSADPRSQGSQLFDPDLPHTWTLTSCTTGRKRSPGPARPPPLVGLAVSLGKKKCGGILAPWERDVTFFVMETLGMQEVGGETLSPVSLSPSPVSGLRPHLRPRERERHGGIVSDHRSCTGDTET